MNLTERLNKHKRAGTLKSFSIFRTVKGYQSNFETTPSSFRVRIKNDPVDAAIDALGPVADAGPRSFENLLK